MVIRALPKTEFDKMMRDMDIDDSNVKHKLNHHMISINYSDTTRFWPKDNRSYFDMDHANVIRLFFDDVLADTKVKMIATGEVVEAKAFTIEDARRLLDFLSCISVNEDTAILVHCHKGISRSVAVAHFAAEYFGIDPSIIYTESRMKANEHVLNTLRKESTNAS